MYGADKLRLGRCVYQAYMPENYCTDSVNSLYMHTTYVHAVYTRYAVPHPVLQDWHVCRLPLSETCLYRCSVKFWLQCCRVYCWPWVWDHSLACLHQDPVWELELGQSSGVRPDLGWSSSSHVCLTLHLCFDEPHRASELRLGWNEGYLGEISCNCTPILQ